MTNLEKMIAEAELALKTANDTLEAANVNELRQLAKTNGIKNSKQYKKEELKQMLANIILPRIENSYKEKIDYLTKATKAAPQEDNQTEPKSENKPKLNRHQRLAALKVRHAYNWIVGGLENSVQDGGLEEMPPVADMFHQVYDMVMTEDCGEGYAGGCSKTELRFAGKQFILDRIAKHFRKDGYEVPEELTRIPEKKPHTGERKNIKGNPEQVGEDEVVMVAFTGMVIGVFKIHKQSKDVIYVKTQKGILGFNKETGLQVAANNPKFANRIVK